MENENKKRILSGIQPTGTFTLGNYIGAVRNWQAMQDEYECLYMIANMHALTVRQIPSDLRRKTRESAALLLACGINPAKSTVFVQSKVPSHSELTWVLSCNAQFGELSRMTQFKDKSLKHPENINAGLFTYPVLMAADILVYNADLVPIGVDQKQHLELARNIAQRFNSAYSDTFTIPEGFIPKTGAKVMSLQEPEKKMSKSDTNENGYILLLDNPDTVMRKCKRAVTDSEARVYYNEDKKGVANLMTIYSVLTGKSYEDTEKEFDGKGYGDFKIAVAESIISAIKPIQEEYVKLLADKTYLDTILESGAERASHIARNTVNKVYKKVGLV
ncbi:MAG: tryptophan--tRNA ligase [Oscillospiraceae bacterium]